MPDPVDTDWLRHPGPRSIHGSVDAGGPSWLEAQVNHPVSDVDDSMVPLDTDPSLWTRIFIVAPLVVVGTQEGEDHYDLAPKHMATPLGWTGLFGFSCNPAHGTYRNAREHGAFTVSYPRPDQVVVTSLTATPRSSDDEATPGLISLPTVPARVVEGRVLRDARLVLECRLERILDGLDESSFVIGRIVAARARPEALRTTGIDDEEVLRRDPPLAFLAPDRYAAISRSHPFPFPAGFNR